MKINVIFVEITNKVIVFCSISISSCLCLESNGDPAHSGFPWLTKYVHVSFNKKSFSTNVKIPDGKHESKWRYLSMAPF